MAERKYVVEYDFEIGKRWHPKKKIVTAKNQKEACEKIKTDYWEKVIALAENRGFSTQKAKRYYHYPFHITAKRYEEGS